VLSAVVKRAGIQCQLVLLPHWDEGLPLNPSRFQQTYPESALGQLSDLTQDSDLIGVSLMSSSFDKAIQITRSLRRSTKAPIVWGGIHPTVCPEECLDYADFVCVGEGEEALPELVINVADGQGSAGIPNVWFRRDGEVVRTPLRPPTLDLDSYPYPDYDFDSEFILHLGRIQPMTRNLFLHLTQMDPSASSAIPYRTVMSRGCSYRCAYCFNSGRGSAYGKHWRVRRRSLPNFIGELRQAVTRFPEIQRILILDDLFLDDSEHVREFSSAYKEAIGLPFTVFNFHPSTIDDEKIGLLADAGLDSPTVGIQTGSMRVMRDIYRRSCTSLQMTQAFEVLHRSSNRIGPPLYQLIGDNPWETEEDQMETLRMLLRVPRPFRLALFSLTFYPGTELYERARSEGLITDNLTQIYRKNFTVPKRTYINGLFALFQSQSVPNWLISTLMSAPLRRLDQAWLPDRVSRLYHFTTRVGRSGRRLFQGDWSPVRNVYRRRFGQVAAKA
ncbi:MAG: radical SAM protein, partial [Dehalococcoidia bacterium]|nr:radical SAM protein [Dehalococcoidia bacterium]